MTVEAVEVCLNSELRFVSLLLPRYRTVKAKAYVWFHSCGYIGPIIPDLIEIGCEILNPIQLECTDPSAVKEQHGRRKESVGGECWRATEMVNSRVIDPNCVVSLRFPLAAAANASLQPKAVIP
jgi:hypothetical protein